MKYLTIGLMMGATLALAPAAMAQDAATERLDDRASFENGQKAWENVCARCHVVGNGQQDMSVGPDLSINEYDPDTIKYFVRNGQLAMPAFPESSIDNATLDDLAAYIAANVYKGEAQ